MAPRAVPRALPCLPRAAAAVAGLVEPQEGNPDYVSREILWQGSCAASTGSSAQADTSVLSQAQQHPWTGYG